MVSERRFCGAKPPIRSIRRATSPVSEHAPEGTQSEPLSPCGQARPTAEPECSKRVVLTLCRTVAEASVRHCAPSQVMAPRANMVAASFTGTRAEARERCFLDTSSAAEAVFSAPKLPCWRLAAEAAGTREGSSGEGMCDSARRSGISRSSSPEGCLPPTSHPGGPQAQDTQRGSNDVSHGVRFLSAYEPRRSLCRFTSPTPSALRVSHSLSGLSPPGPCGFVSRHIRP